MSKRKDEKPNCCQFSLNDALCWKDEKIKIRIKIKGFQSVFQSKYTLPEICFLLPFLKKRVIPLVNILNRCVFPNQSASSKT
jgi:hypothetical protein